MAREKILIVEDEDSILELVTYHMIKSGYNVSACVSGEEAVGRLKEDPPDLVILDLMLPGLNGIEVCKRLKQDEQLHHIPVIMLTARSEEEDILLGLETGADDYITKPFSPKILLARVKAVLRRAALEGEVPSGASLNFKNLAIHPGRHEVRIKGEAVFLTPTEFRILHFLAAHPGWVYSRAQIVSAVRGDDYPVTDRSVDVLMVGLRKKMDGCADYIETVRGVGYRFRSDD